MLPAGLSHRIVHAMQPTFSAGAVAIIEHDGRVLALRQAHRSGWSLPGGLIDAGEQPQDAVVREVREETGLDIEPGSVMATDFDPEIRHVDVIFRVVCDERPEVEVASEALESGWFALDELPHPDKSTRRIQRAVRLARQPSSAGHVVGRGD
nr:NUDIX domain-containing protein [Dermacoccus nishinomiyaensis]